MKKNWLIVTAFFLLLGFAPLAITNAFTSTAVYETVYVKSGDTVWNIAAAIATPKDDIREIIFEIKQLNKLDNNAQVFPGQALKVRVRPGGR